MTPDQIARVLVAQLESLALVDLGDDRYTHGTPIPAYVKEIAERAAQRAHELAREAHPEGLTGNRRYSFHVERKASGWQVVAAIVRVP